ncbi:MAG: hypothetical protein ACJAVR_001469 [Paracoccaceae bacterium]|jgi:hypothetical protein
MTLILFCGPTLGLPRFFLTQDGKMALMGLDHNRVFFYLQFK